MTETRRIVLNVNGDASEVEVPTDETLLDTLRERLHLYSVRGSCGIGICGTCTVLLDGRPISSCLSLAALNAGRAITTSEGLSASDDIVDEVQDAFLSRRAYQCSYCIPAMVLTIRSYLDLSDNPSVEEARELLAGNLCRCGSYPNVLEAVADLIDGGSSAT